MAPASINADKLAIDLHDYMTFRAAKEGREYDLSPEFFRGYLDHGVRLFFGVVIGRTNLLRDEQAPRLFKEWKR